MQVSFTLRKTVLATILLSPALISGLSIPWNIEPNSLADRGFLSGGLVDTSSYVVRRWKEISHVARHDDDDDDDEGSLLPAKPTPTGMYCTHTPLISRRISLC